MQDPSSEQSGAAIHDPVVGMRSPTAHDDGMGSDSVAARGTTTQCGPIPAPGDTRPPAVYPDASRRAGSVTGGVRWLMQLEGLLLCICAGQAYAWLTGDLMLLLVLFFVPDLSVLGYLFGRRVGAFCYNLAHSLTLPLLACAVGMIFKDSWGRGLMLPTMVWICHIGLNRALGYGLRYVDGFRFTHLGYIGAQPEEFDGRRRQR